MRSKRENEKFQGITEENMYPSWEALLQWFVIKTKVNTNTKGVQLSKFEKNHKNEW